METYVNIQIFFLNLMRICFLVDPNAAEVKLIPSLNAMKSVGSNFEVIGGYLKRLYGKRKQF